MSLFQVVFNSMRLIGVRLRVLCFLYVLSLHQSFRKVALFVGQMSEVFNIFPLQQDDDDDEDDDEEEEDDRRPAHGSRKKGGEV